MQWWDSLFSQCDFNTQVRIRQWIPGSTIRFCRTSIFICPLFIWANYTFASSGNKVSKCFFPYWYNLLFSSYFKINRIYSLELLLVYTCYSKSLCFDRTCIYRDACYFFFIPYFFFVFWKRQIWIFHLFIDLDSHLLGVLACVYLFLEDSLFYLQLPLCPYCFSKSGPSGRSSYKQ